MKNSAKKRLNQMLASLTLCSWTVGATTDNQFTFEQLVSMAFSQNLTLQIQQQQNLAVQADESIAFRRMLPSLSLSSGRVQTLQNTASPSSEVTAYSSTVVLSQPIYQPTVWANYRKAELQRTRADKALEKQRQTLLFELKQGWYNLLKEQQLNQEAGNSLARLKQHQKNAEAFYRSGKIWRNDVLQAQVRVSRGEQDIFAANNRLTLAQSQLNILLDRPVDTPLIPIGNLDRKAFNRPFNGLLTQALSNRLELKQSEIDISLAQRDLDIAKAKHYPTVNFSLSAGASSPDINYQSATAETVASLNLSWNLWQWGQTNREIDAAEADLTVEQLRLRQQKTAVMAEVQRAYLTVMESQKSLNVSEQALKQAEENFKVSQIRYKEQLGSSNDVLDAQDLLTLTKNDRVAALARYLTAIAELDLAVGVVY